jgi:hypothetical protein
LLGGDDGDDVDDDDVVVVDDDDDDDDDGGDDAVMGGGWVVVVMMMVMANKHSSYPDRDDAEVSCGGGVMPRGPLQVMLVDLILHKMHDDMCLLGGKGRAQCVFEGPGLLERIRRRLESELTRLVPA